VIFTHSTPPGPPHNAKCGPVVDGDVRKLREKRERCNKFLSENLKTSDKFIYLGVQRRIILKLTPLKKRGTKLSYMAYEDRTK